jgi:hypothetical protein
LSSHFSKPTPNLYVNLVELSSTHSGHSQSFSHLQQFSQDGQSNMQPPALA